MGKSSNIKTFSGREIPQFYDITNNNLNRMTQEDILIRNLPKKRGIIQSIFDMVNTHKKKMRKENTQKEYIHLQRKLSSNSLRIQEIKLKEEELIEYNRLDIEELKRQNDSILYKLNILKDKLRREDEELNRFENKLFRFKNK